MKELIDAVIGSPRAIPALLEHCEAHKDEPACEALLIAGRGFAPQVLPYEEVYYMPWNDAEEQRVAWQRLLELLEHLPHSTELEEALGIILSRGWPDRVRILPPGWLERFCGGDPQEPWMSLFRALFFDGVDPDLGRLFETVHLSKISYLTILSGDLAWSRLPPTEHAASLSHLAIDASPEGLCVEALTKLALPRLSHLGLVSCDIGTEHLRAIADTARWRRPETLDLSMNPDCNPNLLTDESVELLASHPAFSRLESLSLSSGDRLSDEAIVALAASPNLHKLARLRISADSELGDEAFIALAHSVHLGCLERLECRRRTWDAVSDAAEAEAMLREHLPSLKTVVFLE